MRISICMMKLFTLLVLICPAALHAQTKSPSHQIYTQLLKRNVNDIGQVDYKGIIRDSVEFDKYLQLLTDNPPHKSWSRNEQIAYWINAYNAFTIKLITKYYPVKSIKDIGSSIQIPFVNTPWDIKFIIIGRNRYDLNNIEHGILRKKFDDPRIHMALVCASKSCPILLNEAYDASLLDNQLAKQTRAFLADPYRNKLSQNEPKLSMIFKWYEMDFTKNGKTVRDFVNAHTTVPIKADAKISYVEYDWSLNE